MLASGVVGNLVKIRIRFIDQVCDTYLHFLFALNALNVLKRIHKPIIQPTRMATYYNMLLEQTDTDNKNTYSIFIVFMFTFKFKFTTLSPRPYSEVIF